MNAFFWLAPLVLVGVVGAGYYAHRHDLIELGRTLHNQKILFTSNQLLAPRAELPPVADIVSLSTSALNDAVARLIEYATEVNPDWIVGVHPGGRLLSVYMADKINLDASRCLFVRTDPDRTDRLVFELPPNEKMSGTLLVIDDISRTGDTLEALKLFFVERNFTDVCALQRIYFAVLLVVSIADYEESFRPDWVRFRTDNRWFKLPWTDLAVKVKTTFAAKRMGLHFDPNVIEQHERMTIDHNYTLGLAKKYFV